MSKKLSMEKHMLEVYSKALFKEAVSALNREKEVQEIELQLAKTFTYESRLSFIMKYVPIRIIYDILDDTHPIPINDKLREHFRYIVCTRLDPSDRLFDAVASAYLNVTASEYERLLKRMEKEGISVHWNNEIPVSNYTDEENENADEDENDVDDENATE